jgi:hypothetical protein
VGGFFDGHPLVNWRHENLMRLFFRALRAYVQPGGIVKANPGSVGLAFFSGLAGKISGLAGIGAY